MSEWKVDQVNYRMAACSLLVVVDEDIVPGDGPHVEGVEGAEQPGPGDYQQGQQKYMKTFF